MELALDYRIYKSYRVDSKIGKGVYGQVYKVFEKGSEKPLAIKKIIDAFQNLTDAKRTYRELAYLLQLSHPCIVKLEKVIIGEQDQAVHKNVNKNVYAVFQLMEIDLAKTLQITKLQILQRKYIAMQVLFGLEYLHSSELIHRDIKPSNILLNQSCEAKICDFGLVRMANEFHEASKINDQVFTQYVASKWYRSPEIMLSGNQVSTYAIDMWSTGCVLAQMCLGVPLFNGNNTIQQLQKIFMIIGMPLQSQIESISSENGKFLLKNFRKIKRTPLTQILLNQASPQEIDLISKLLLFDPHKRITAKQAINHPFFDELEDLKEKFKYFPTKVIDNSLRKSDPSLQTYRQLIESLCVTTKRASTTRSKESLQSDLSTKQMPRYQSSKLQQKMKEKSTRQSNSGLLKKYKVERKKEELQKQGLESFRIIEGNRIKNKPESKVSLKARSKSKQSTKSINNKKMNTSHSNKSKPKLTQYKSCNKIKPFKPQISINQKPEHSIKISKKKKKG